MNSTRFGKAVVAAAVLSVLLLFVAKGGGQTL